MLADFETIADAPGGIGRLRQAILQLAVQGKLVTQDPEDEPARELLERLRAQGAVASRKGGTQRKLALSSETPFELPSSWGWAYLGEISARIHYGYTASANHEAGDARLLRITDIQDNRVNWPSVPWCAIASEKIEDYLLSAGDILIARTGGTIGKSYLVQDVAGEAVFASYLIRVKVADAAHPAYIKLALESPLYWTQLIARSAGTGQPNVNATALSSLLLPIPPYREQHRIVAKVSALMALCDQLEARLQSQETTSTRLAAAAVHTLAN
jgi:type I restriction enzyme S subunit